MGISPNQPTTQEIFFLPFSPHTHRTAIIRDFFFIIVMSFVRKTQAGPKPQVKRPTNIPYSKPNTSKKEDSPIPEPAKSNILEETTPIANINTLSQDNTNKDRYPDDSPHDRNILPYRPGMEDGYDKSLMAKLWRSLHSPTIFLRNP